MSTALQADTISKRAIRHQKTANKQNTYSYTITEPVTVTALRPSEGETVALITVDEMQIFR